MGATADKARKARERARTQNSNRGSTGSTDRLVMDLTRGKSSLSDKVTGRYVNEPEQRAANVMQQRRALDTGKTAARATAIEKRTAKKKAADTLKTGVSGSAKKATPKKNYVTDKKTGKPLSMDTKNPQEAGVGSVAKVAIKLGTKAVQKIIAKPAAKKVATKVANKIVNKSVVSAAKGFTKEAAKEKAIIAKLDKAHPKAQAKAQKIINKAVKKNPNLFK